MKNALIRDCARLDRRIRKALTDAFGPDISMSEVLGKNGSALLRVPGLGHKRVDQLLDFVRSNQNVDHEVIRAAVTALIRAMREKLEAEESYRRARQLLDERDAEYVARTRALFAAAVGSGLERGSEEEQS